MTDQQLLGHLRFFGPVLDVLRHLGGSARPAQVRESIIKGMKDSELERPEVISRVGNQIDWARFYLAKSGYLDSSKRGVWTLTERGRSTVLTPAKVKEIVQEVAATSKAAGSKVGETSKLDGASPPQQADHRFGLLETIKELPARGFEELCQYLLLESGFETVKVKGKSGDEGIDGEGVLRVSKLVSMKVLFQCKRFRYSVGPSIVRDFRGSLAGRAEKGIILTTGYFTSAAEQEARRDGVIPVELVDGDRLVELFEEMEIGLKNPRSIYDVDDEFFGRFR